MHDYINVCYRPEKLRVDEHNRKIDNYLKISSIELPVLHTFYYVCMYIYYTFYLLHTLLHLCVILSTG